MADLLEALLQIKALAETPARVAALVRTAERSRWGIRRAAGERTPAEILVHLADAELVFCASARLIVSVDRPLLPLLERRAPGAGAATAPHAPDADLERFRARRSETVELLASCSAAALERVGVHPVRREVTLADVAAIMLAHDIDHLGQMRERLGVLGAP